MPSTVRVANPADPANFMTINTRDYRELVHGPLWSEQAEGFEGLPAPEPQRTDPAVRDLAATVMYDMVDIKHAQEGKPLFGTLSPGQQLTTLRDLHQEVKQAQREMRRRYQISDREQAERAAQQADADRDTDDSGQGGDTLSGGQNTTNSGQDTAAGGDGGGDTVAGAQGGAQVPEPAPGATTAAQAGTNPWAGTPAAPPAQQQVPLTVEKGPGSKWFVMRGKDPVSDGYATKTEAEKRRSEIEG